jgi:hypothetical protein
MWWTPLVPVSPTQPHLASVIAVQHQPAIKYTMKLIDANELWQPTGLATASVCLAATTNDNDDTASEENPQNSPKAGVRLTVPPHENESVFDYIRRLRSSPSDGCDHDGSSSSVALDLTLYHQIVGAANSFKEGDLTVGVAAHDETTRQYARTLLEHTPLEELQRHALFTDGIYELISQSTTALPGHLKTFTLGDLKTFLLTKSEEEIHTILPALSSDVIACLVKIMSNEELIHVGQTVFTPLPGSKVGAKVSFRRNYVERTRKQLCCLFLTS